MHVRWLKIGPVVTTVLLLMVAILFQPGLVRGEQTVNTDKDTYGVGEKIKVHFSNAPGNDSDWITIVPAGSPDTEGGDYKYTPKGSGQGFLVFDPPPPGNYEARAYYDYSRKGYVVSGRHAFSVGSGAAGGMAGPAAQAGKATRDDYVLFQTVTFGDPDKPVTGLSTPGSLAVLKTPNGNMVDYELWVQGRVPPNSNQGKKEPVYGPVRFSRNPATEEVSFSTKGFGLAEDVINQVMNQVEKNPRTAGTWNQDISLKLLGAHFPRKLAFHFDVQNVELKPGVHALMIRTYTDVFTVEILPTATNADNGVFSGTYKGVLVYSPEDHRMYQMASAFDAGKGDEILKIQETAFLAGPDGKPVYPLLDMRDVLDLEKPGQPVVNPILSMPRWAVQALKVHEVVSFASATTADRASNSAGFSAIAAEVLETSGISDMAGLPSMESLIATYAETHGGQGAKLAARFFTNVTFSAAGEMLPPTLLATNAPALAAILTAGSVYTMYEISADLYATWLWQGVLTQKPWPGSCGPDCFARANAAYDLKEPYKPEPDPGPPPEPPAAPRPSSARWVVPAVVGGAAIAAGIAMGLSGAGGDVGSDGGGGSNSCSSYDAYAASNCCKTSGGIQLLGFPVPVSCGRCATGTTDSHSNTVINGVTYYQCLCNGC